MAARKGRRGAGEGAIYKDASGRWRATVDLGWKDGKRQRKYLSGRTRAEVAEKLRTVRREQEDGVAIVTGTKPSTMEQWLTFWLDTIAARKVRPSTLATYRGYARNRIIPALGKVRLDQLAPEHLEAFYRRCEKEGLAAATVLQVHRIISRALKVAHRRGKVPRNVAALVDPPSVYREEVRPLTAADQGDVKVGTAWRLEFGVGCCWGPGREGPWTWQTRHPQEDLSSHAKVFQKQVPRPCP